VAKIPVPRLCFFIAALHLAVQSAAPVERSAGADSFGERAAFAQAASRLEAAGAAYRKRSLSASMGAFGASLVADFPGSAPRSRESGIDSLVLAVPLSTSSRPADAPLDYGVRVALALADRLRRSPPAIDVRIAFLGDEKSELPADLREGLAHAGLREMAESYGAEADRAVFVYLDLPEQAARFQIAHGSSEGGRGSLAPRNLVAALGEAFSARGVPLSLAMPYSELYRLALVRGPEELRILRERGISAVLISASYRDLSAGDGPAPPEAEATAAALDLAILKLAQNAEEDEERYSIMAPVFLILTEEQTVLIFVGMSALFLFAFLVYSLTHRHLTVARLKVFVKRLWVILAFWIAVFFCVRAAGLTLSFLLAWTKTTPASNPYGAAAIKLLLLFCFYYAAAPLLALKPFPRRAHFYGSASLACLSAGALIAAALDFSFVPIFIWSFSLAFLSTVIRSPSAAVIPTVLAPLQIAGAAAAAVGSGDPDTAFAILNSDPLMELYFAFLALPFLFLFRRLSIQSRARMIRRARLTSSAHTSRRYTRPILVAGALAAGAVFARDTAEAELRRPLPVRAETADPSVFSLTAKDATFLDRRIAAISLRSEGRPLRFDVSLSSPSPITVYDAPVPYVLSDDGLSARFVLGERPSNPLELEITLPESLAAKFESHALYYDASVDSATAYRASVELGPAPTGAGGKK
jgi:hypothetical protein